MSGKQRKSASRYASERGGVDDLVAVLRRELREHYEMPQDLSHQILALMLALNDQDESALRPLPRASDGEGGLITGGAGGQARGGERTGTGKSLGGDNLAVIDSEAYHN